MRRQSSDHLVSPDQFEGLIGPLGSYGDPGPVGAGWQGTGILGARAEIPPDAGTGSGY